MSYGKPKRYRAHPPACTCAQCRRRERIAHWYRWRPTFQLSGPAPGRPVPRPRRGHWKRRPRPTQRGSWNRWLVIVIAAVLLAGAAAWIYPQATDATATHQQPVQVPAHDPQAAGVLERLSARSSTERIGTKCNGSMAPAVTCVDEITYRTWFDPPDIVPGSIIVFHPGCTTEGTTGNLPVVHGVVEVKVEQRRYSYWPKGDARREADGCWIPAEQVKGYLVAVHAGVRPENIELRDEVATARAKLNGLMDRYCGVGVISAECQLQSARSMRNWPQSAVFSTAGTKAHGTLSIRGTSHTGARGEMVATYSAAPMRDNRL